MRITAELLGRHVLYAGLGLLAVSAVLAEDAQPPTRLPVRDDRRIRASLDRGRLTEAEAFATRALRTAEERSGRESLAAADAIDLLLAARDPAGRAFDPQSLALAERALAIRTRVQGESHPDRIESLHNLLRILRTRGDLARARTLAEQAVALAEQVHGREHAVTAHSLYELAALLTEVGDATRATEVAERGLAVAERAAPRDSLLVAESLLALAGARFRSGDSAAAVAPFQRALRLRQAHLGPHHPLVAQSTGGLGVALRATGERDAGERLLRESVALYDRLNALHPGLLAPLNSLALVARSRGDYSEARRLWERALAISERVNGAEHPYVAGLLNNLANLLKVMGSYDAALESLQRCLVIRERSRGPDHPEVAQALTNLAAVQTLMGRHAQARASIERAVAIREKAHGRDSAEVGKSLSVLGETLFAAGDWDRARATYERAVSVMEHVGGSLDLDLANALVGLGVVRQHQAALREAGDSYQRALGLFQETLDARHPRVGETLAHLGLLAAQRGDARAALRLALRAEEIAREHLRLTNRALSEREGLAYAEARTRGLDLALSLIARHAEALAPELEAVADALVRSRAVVMDEMTARRKRLREMPDAGARRLQKEATDAGDDLAALLVRGPGKEGPAAFRASLASARERFDKAERAVAERAGGGGPGVSTTARLVREALPPGSTLVAFARYDQEPVDGPVEAPWTPSYLALVLRSDNGAPTVVPLGPAASIEQAIVDWQAQVSREPRRTGRSAVREAEAACRAAGQKLRKAVWDPLVPYLGRAETTFVVPDGMLLFVPFAALPLDDGGFLIEGPRAVHTLTAEKDLLAKAFEHPAGAGLLAIGGAAFDRAPSGFAGAAAAPTAPGPGATGCQDLRAVRFAPLAHSAAEADDVARLFRTYAARGATPRAVVLRGPDASEAAFRRLAAGQRILHIATHGFFLGDCRRPTAAGARGIGGLVTSADGTSVASPNDAPRRLAGLALAGANRRQATTRGADDGILTAEEIAQMDLEGVEWAVLSACDSGAGTVATGEGVLGLRRAFLSAGARTVIMSLWGVDDASAREWMTTLYEARLGRGLTTAGAVRAASLETLRKRRAQGRTPHPFYWAPFVAAGDWR